VIFVLAAAMAMAAAAPSNCTSEASRQFDFWLGNWAVSNGRGEADGTARIERTAGGCGILEYRIFRNGQTGTAINVFDPVRGRWSQLWSSPGTIVRLEGQWIGGQLATEGSIAAGGRETPLRVVWRPNADGSVTQTFTRRTPAPAEWQPMFVSTYRRFGGRS